MASTVAESSPPPEPPVAAPILTEAPAEPIPVPASSGTISYELFYRGSGGSIGRSVQTWRIDSASYRLTSLSEPVGLVALFLPYEFAYTSEGRIGPDGLQPTQFTSRSGRGGSRRGSDPKTLASGIRPFGQRIRPEGRTSRHTCT